jgi:hypothetical protein
LLLDSKRRYIHVWMPRHKFFEVKAPFPTTRPVEVVHLVDITRPLKKGTSKDMTDIRKQLFNEQVHIAMDNFFSSGKVLWFLGEGGWKATVSCRRDCLSKSVPKMYFNCIKAAPVNSRSKVARFKQPTITIKNVKQPAKKSSNNDANEQRTRSSNKSEDEPVSEKKY